MKNFNLLSLVIAVTFVFTSCSSNESLELENPNASLLNSYTVKRDASGAYSLDYNLNDNATVDNVKDVKNNTNQIFLYSSENQTGKKITQNLTIDGEQLKISFVDTKSNVNNTLIIFDDNAALSKSEDITNKLQDYNITSNNDGTYTLDFNVSDNVRVDFVYNENIDTYEIHLEDGEGNGTSFSRVLEKEVGKDLKFDFVNHIYSANSRTLQEIIRKPRGIIIND